MSKSFLEIKGVSKKFGSIVALDNIKSDVTPISPIGVRVSKRTAINHLKEFKKNIII